MAFVYGDRVKETSLTTGTGTMALGGATVGFQTFLTGVLNGNETFYGIVNTADDSWEMGRGTVGPGTLSRDTVISSSNSNLAVNFIAGTKVVYTTVPNQFFAGALDAPAHEAVDHTAAPFNLMDTGVHDGVDHTAAPFNLLSVANLPGEHALIDHTAGPLNLLDGSAHDVIDHTAGPFNLLDAAAHNSLNHNLATNNNPIQVTSPERIAGTEPTLRSYSPLDVATMAGIHGAGASSIVVQQQRASVAGLVAIALTIPANGSIPTTAQGLEVLNVPITPTNASNILLIEFSAMIAAPGAGAAISALFVDAIVSAIAATQMVSSVGSNLLVLRFYVTAASTTPRTYRIRCGADNGASELNSNGAGVPAFGGLATAVLTVTEFLP